MRILMLRGKVPTDRPKEEIMYNSLSDNCDMWTQLNSELIGSDYGEIWYWAGHRVVNYNSHMTERWIRDFSITKFDFKPDVIIARGGFAEYHKVLSRHPKAFKIYYGANGNRYLPRDFYKYNLVLLDHPRQLLDCKKQLPQLRAELLIKPAADNIFIPAVSDKKYDVIMVSNYSEFKGVDLFLDTVHGHLKAIHVGTIPQHISSTYGYVDFMGKRKRKSLPELYAAAKVAVCCSSERDSNPRVIPEALACNCPLIVLDTCMVWKEKYIVPETGLVSTKSNLLETIHHAIARWQDFKPRQYYENNLSLACAAKHIIGLINGT